MCCILPASAETIRVCRAAMYGCLLEYPDEDCTDILWILYSGKLSREKLSQIGDFREENFRGLLAFATPKNAMPQISQRKLPQIGTKTQQKFSPSKVSSYDI